MSIFRVKNLATLMEEIQTYSMQKTLGYFDLIMIGIGAIIGTGIFVITGTVAAKYAGPAITLSFLLAGIVCVFTALAYAELASSIPAAGGAYVYSYLVFGEVFAWISGCCILIVCTGGASAVAAGWSGYIIGIIHSMGYDLPILLTKIPAEGGLINLPAVIISIFISLILLKGTKESATLNATLVILKLAIILLFILAAIPNFKMELLTDNFMPFGFSGVATGAATVFIAYAGFDTVAMAAEECKNPKRDLPIGIIGSLVLCALLYIIVSGLLVGNARYDLLNNAEPMAYALRINGSNIGGTLVAVGAVVGMTTVLMMQIFGQSRVIFSMSRDGMLPKFFGKLHPKYDTPFISILITGACVALCSGFLPITTMSNLSSMATLATFMFVSAGVIVMRIKKPELKRPFKCPIVYVMAPISILMCMYLFMQLIGEEGKEFFGILLVGLCVYGVYGYKNSIMANPNNQ